MSNTSNIVTVALGFLGTTGSSVATFLRSAKKYEEQIAIYVRKVESEVNTVLNKVQVLTTKVESLAPAPKPVATKAPTKKAAPAPTPKPRRAGR